MTNKRVRNRSDPSLMDITPLIDCVFLLIVFFVVAGKFKKVESRLDAYLPKTGISGGVVDKVDRFFISIICKNNSRADKLTWLVNDIEVDNKTELVRRIKSIRDSSEMEKDIKVTIDGDPQVQYFWYIASLDACAEAELTEIMFMPPRVGSLDNWPSPTPRLLRKR